MLADRMTLRTPFRVRVDFGCADDLNLPSSKTAIENAANVRHFFETFDGYLNCAKGHFCQPTGEICLTLREAYFKMAKLCRVRRH